jgi:hypothetical protein
MISFPSNNYPAIERPCAPYNETDFIETPSFTPSEIVLADYVSYPTAQGTEVFQTVQIQQISDSVGSYGTDQQVFQGTVQSKVKWATLANQTETFQTDVYTSSQYQGLFDITCPANTNRVDLYAISQGGIASASGPKFKVLTYETFYTKISIFGPGTGASGTSVSMLGLPAQEGVCFRGQFQTSGPYLSVASSLFSVIDNQTIMIAETFAGNWAGDPNIGDSEDYPGNGYVGFPRGAGGGNIKNLIGSLNTIVPGTDGVYGTRFDTDFPIESSVPDPPADQIPSVNQAFPFTDNFGRPFGSGGYFVNLYCNGNEPGYLHADMILPNEAAIIVVSYINT